MKLAASEDKRFSRSVLYFSRTSFSSCSSEIPRLFDKFWTARFWASLIGGLTSCFASEAFCSVLGMGSFFAGGDDDSGGDKSEGFVSVFAFVDDVLRPLVFLEFPLPSPIEINHNWQALRDLDPASAKEALQLMLALHERAANRKLVSRYCPLECRESRRIEHLLTLRAREALRETSALEFAGPLEPDRKAGQPPREDILHGRLWPVFPEEPGEQTLIGFPLLVQNPVAPQAVFQGV